jgi:hypothetical protein
MQEFNRVNAARGGTLLLAAGCLPFAAGALLGPAGTRLPGPFREATGLPCPFCGASRAFAAAARGEIRYNAAWLVIAVLAALLGAAILVARRAPALTRRRALWAIALVGAVTWAYALAERAAITRP